MRKINTDIIVIGAGLAGIFTALNIDSKLEVSVIVKADFKTSNSTLAQGGIAGEFNTNYVNRQEHIADTLKAGSYVNNKKAVEELVNNASKTIEKLISFGVNFDKDEHGDISLTMEAGHSTKRILHIGGDSTGKEIIIALRKEILSRKNIKFYGNSMALDLVHNNNNCYGVTIMNSEDEILYLNASKTVLATGGIGSVFGSSTNSLLATGDGIGMAYRANVKVNNMEFIQFHPTALYDESNDARRRFLISEAVRGEGAYLVNTEGERFMEKYDSRMELAPRDVVSQSIFKEMYDTWTDHVFLDTRHLDTQALEKRFPTIFHMCKSKKYIMGIDLIPVAPVQHFSVGGITTNLNGETSMKNLYACGECADTGVHGANRLASNSLLECVVFGGNIAERINSLKNEYSDNIIPNELPKLYKYSYRLIRDKTRSLMDEYSGIVRSKDGLEFALVQITKYFENLTKHPNISRNYYKTLNIVTTALIIIKQAHNRTESLGSHYMIKNEG